MGRSLLKQGRLTGAGRQEARVQRDIAVVPAMETALIIRRRRHLLAGEEGGGGPCRVSLEKRDISDDLLTWKMPTFLWQVPETEGQAHLERAFQRRPPAPTLVGAAHCPGRDV